MAEPVSEQQAELLRMQDEMHAASVKARTVAIDRLRRYIEQGTNWLDKEDPKGWDQMMPQDLARLTDALERIIPRA